MVNYYLSLSTLNNICINTKKLEEIDLFTKNFVNEEDLKKYLLKNNLISKSDIHKDLFITYKYNYKINKCDIVYKDDYKYTDINYLRYYLISNKDNIKMLKKLYNKIYYNKSQEANLNALRNYIEYSDYCSESFIINTINNILAKECFSYNYKKDEYKLRYKSVRDIGLLIKENKIKKEETKQLSFFDNKKRTF